MKQKGENMTENIMETTMLDADRINISGAIKAFFDYLSCAKYYGAEKDELQKQLNVIRNTIEGTRSRIGQYSISDKAIRMAEELADMSSMDRLFINYCTNPDIKAENIQSWWWVYDNENHVCVFKSVIQAECQDWVQDHNFVLENGDMRYVVFDKIPCHVQVQGEDEILFVGIHDDCEKHIGTKQAEGSQLHYTIAPSTFQEPVQDTIIDESEGTEGADHEEDTAE